MLSRSSSSCWAVVIGPKKLRYFRSSNSMILPRSVHHRFINGRLDVMLTFPPDSPRSFKGFIRIQKKCPLSPHKPIIFYVANLVLGFVLRVRNAFAASIPGRSTGSRKSDASLKPNIDCKTEFSFVIGAKLFSNTQA